MILADVARPDRVVTRILDPPLEQLSTTFMLLHDRFKSQRGIVPMSSFIEWRSEGGVKQPWMITTPRHAIAVAALWDVWEKGDEPLLSCTLVTTAAAPAFEPWHRRMPVMLTPDESRRWLDNSVPIAADDPVFAPVLKETLELQPLSRAVSNSRNKDISVLESAGDVVELAV